MARALKGFAACRRDRAATRLGFGTIWRSLDEIIRNFPGERR